MRRTNFLSLVIASVIGGLAIHGLFVACSGGSGAATANAQSAQCQQWAFVTLAGSSFSESGPSIPTANGGTISTLVPDGWEPIGSEGIVKLLRRCVK